MFKLEQIACALGARIPMEEDHSQRTAAAVALILLGGPTEQTVLFIERAHHAQDPWSGDLGFPGGKINLEDADPQATAEREALEELGLDLRKARFLGRLDDLLGAHLPVVVSCFVYHLAELPEFRLNDEIRNVFTVPISDLFDPARRFETIVDFQGSTLSRPAIRLPVSGRDILWGITYRLVMNLADILVEGTGEVAADGSQSEIAFGLGAVPSERP